MPRRKPDQIDFTELVSKKPDDIEGGFCWILSHHILKGNIALMGWNGKGWAVWTYFRAKYSTQRQWVQMPNFTDIAEATGISRNTIPKICKELEEKNFIQYKRDENGKPTGFKVIDNTFVISGTEQETVSAITHPFEPENATKTVQGYNYFKRTGDISKIPDAVLDKNPPINQHITINFTTINNTTIKQEATGGGQNISINIGEDDAYKWSELLDGAGSIKDKFGMSLGEMLSHRKKTGELPPVLMESEIEEGEED